MTIFILLYNYIEKLMCQTNIIINSVEVKVRRLNWNGRVIINCTFKNLHESRVIFRLLVLCYHELHNITFDKKIKK